MTDRRQFLKAGAASGLALALAGRLPSAWARIEESARPPALGEKDRVVLAAIVPVMLDGALPATPAEREAAIGATVDGVGIAVAGLPNHSREELGELFMLLDLPLTRRLLAGVSRPWPEASHEDIAGFLQSWRTHRIGLLRSGYQALHELIMAAWYALPASWSAIQYPGPPKVG